MLTKAPWWRDWPRISQYKMFGSPVARGVSSIYALCPHSRYGQGLQQWTLRGEVKGRMTREAPGAPTEGHTIAPPPFHLILKQLHSSIFERPGSSRPHSKQVAVPGFEPRTVWLQNTYSRLCISSLHKEALNKSMLNYILNQEFAYLKLEAETMATAAWKNTKWAFVSIKIFYLLWMWRR